MPVAEMRCHITTTNTLLALVIAECLLYTASRGFWSPFLMMFTQ